MTSEGGSSIFLFVLLVAQLSYLPLCRCLRCYSCTSSLPPESNEYAKNMAKKVIPWYYVLPEVSSLCNNPTDPDFVNVLKVDCENPRDVCSKITASVEGLEFTIRGCKNSVFRSPPNTTVCDPSSSPSYCECSEDLCNGSAMAGIQFGIYLSTVLVASVNFVRFY